MPWSSPLRRVWQALRAAGRAIARPPRGWDHAARADTNDAGGDPLEHFVAAIREAAAGGEPGLVSMTGEGGTVSFVVPVEHWLSVPTAPDSVEQQLLARARGHVLDIGACAGRMAHALVARGHAVTCLDAHPDLVALMRDAGLDAVLGDARALPEGTWDTLLLADANLGLCERLSALVPWLEHLATRLAPGGRILGTSLQSLSPADLFDRALQRRGIPLPPRHRDSPDALLAGAIPHIGDAVVRIGRGTSFGPPFPWLYVSPELLVHAAAKAGLDCTIEVPGPQYVAVLTRRAD